tara:strand:- start:31445 stop:33493 length:2049 start_codon:yes stop_codon:yes gene_type:complete
MPYESIPGVGATYLDGAFARPTVSTQPKIIILGTAEKGLSYRLYNVRSVAAAEEEFGKTAEFMKPLHEALAQGADNIAVMRIGGTKGVLNIVESSGGKLKVTPEYRDDKILERYSMVVTANADSDARVLIWDLQDEQWVYDSDEILVIDLGIVKVEFTTVGSDKWLHTHTTGDINYPDDSTKTKTLAELKADGLWTGVGSFTTGTATAGTDGHKTMAQVQRYAALEHAYGILDYRDGDYVIPCGTHMDAWNVTDTDDYSHWTGGGSPMRTGPSFSSVPTAGETSGTNIDMLGFLWQYQYRGKVYTWFLNTPNPATATVLSHADLTGDTVPTAVTDKYAAAVAAEVRECSFAHQLASFCYRASTVWKSMIGIISTRGPDGYDRSSVAEWAGQLPELTYFGTDLGIDAVADNGDGLLGHKFVGGATSYRDGILDASSGATTTDGLAYGGYILTKGESLPNGTNYVYGINDNDEAVDANKKPIDIGKHLLVTYDYPVLSNSYNGGSNYRGTFCGTLAGKLAVTPDNEEPIGINGRVRRISSPLRIKPPQMNELARGRLVGVRAEEGVGFIIVSCRTAAHPTSDYARLSTIRSVNREIDGIRDIAKNYIGKEFSSTRLMSLQTAIDGFLKSERALGFNQGAIASLSYTRADKIMGRLTIKLKMIPPFSIEAITIETSLAAEETELT